MKLKGVNGTAVVLDEPCGSAGESLFDGTGASEHWPGTEMTAQIP